MRFALVALLLVPACGPEITMVDDIDLTWDFSITLDRFKAVLHTPYVKGAPVTIHVSSDDEDEDTRGWSVTSTNPAVFLIDGLERGDGHVTARGVAIGEGTASLVVRDGDGDRLGSGAVEVLAPDRITLQAHGFLLVGDEDAAPVDELRLLAGGTATYLVKYFRGARPLHGNGVLSVTAPAGLVAEPRTTHLFENREWLTVTAPAPGTTLVTLHADGGTPTSIPTTTVPESAIDEIEILTGNERRADEGDWLVALAQAYDAEGRRIFGVAYDWDVDDVAEPGRGDLYRYRYAADLLRTLEARRGGKTASVEIHVQDGYVSSSNRIGCTAAPGGAGGAPWTFALAGLAALLVRRRARRLAPGPGPDRAGAGPAGSGGPGPFTHAIRRR
jgi:MYXO-CTERM domain-containing protein